MTIIAMTREMGTLGKEVARDFARRMNYVVLHHELVESASERVRQQEESEVYRFLEGDEEALSRWRGNRSDGGYLTPAEVIEIAMEGDALIRGWGATRLLRSAPNVLTVRVCAPMEFRVEQMKERLGIDGAMARREIERSDAAHGRTFMRFFETDWRDPQNYDMVLNTAHLSPKVCADILVDAVAGEMFIETEATKRVLNDLLIAARVSSALAEDAALRRRGRHIRVTVADAEVRLFGIVTDGASRQIAQTVAASQHGVRGLRNEIVRAGSFE